MENENYYRIEKAIKYITDNFKEQPNLEDVSSYLNISPYHFQKIFSEWAGISPKKFLEYLTINFLKEKIYDTKNIDEASEIAGLSSQSRVYDLFVNIEAVTPNEYKTKGNNLKIEYGFHKSPFGEVLLATTERGITDIQFLVNDNKDLLLQQLKNKWSNSMILENTVKTKEIADKLFSSNYKNNKFNVLLKGTNFQVKVWEALLKIPDGLLVTYQTIANQINNPKAVRAVGTAIGSNPVAFLIPCHRVIRKEGKIGDYRWGTERKKIIVGYEMAKSYS